MKTIEGLKCEIVDHPKKEIKVEQYCLDPPPLIFKPSLFL